MSEDPIGLAGGINPYTFVGNSPMEERDPSGLAPVQLATLVVVASKDSCSRGSCLTGSDGVFGGGGGGSSGGYGSLGGGGGGGGGGCPECEDEQTTKPTDAENLCGQKIAIAALNSALDLAGGRMIYGAVAAAGRIAPKVGWRYALGIYKGDIAQGLTPGLAPTSLNFGGAVATSDGSFTGKDLALFLGGFVPFVGSGIAIADAIATCSAGS